MKKIAFTLPTKVINYMICLSILALGSCKKSPDTPLPETDGTVRYTMPDEATPHEGTWLQWPHDKQYGAGFRSQMEPAWIEMTRALQTAEKVHIVAYDQNEKAHIESVLADAGVPMTNVDFFIIPTNDYWTRDNGPIFVFDENDQLTITDWGFNGWGNDAAYDKCNAVPGHISSQTGIPSVDLNGMVLEGGAIEIDGQGTMMATRSSVTHRSRNPHLTEKEIETYMTTYLGITNFIWLDGTYGLEITDNHIDGAMKFIGNNTILTMEEQPLRDQGLSDGDIALLYSATNASGEAYTFDYLPETQNNVSNTNGQSLGYKGSYVNFYIGNAVVLVPIYQDPNDQVALDIIQQHFPNRDVVGIDARDMYELGGMVHCVTQQQPVAR